MLHEYNEIFMQQRYFIKLLMAWIGAIALGCVPVLMIVNAVTI